MGIFVFGLERVSQLITGTDVLSVSLVLALVLCISLYINHRLKNAHLYALAANIPGPPTLPFIGNAHSLIGLDMTGIVEKLSSLKDLYGFPQRFWFGSELCIMLMSPKDIEAVLTSRNAVNKNSAYSFFKCQTNGIFVTSGEKWHLIRRLTGPTFNMKLLEKFVQVFNRQSEILVEMLASEDGQGIFDIKDYASRCTLDMICETQMGVKTKEQRENTVDFCNKLSRSTEIVFTRIYKLYLHPEFIFNLTPYHKENQVLIRPLHRFAREIIRQRMEALANESGTRGKWELGSDSNKKRDIFLDTMLESFPEKNVEQLVHETFGILIAGSDTSAVTISYTLMMLAMHPEYQEKVFKEQCELFPNLDSPITMNDLNKMKYLEMVIRESLRICGPPAVVRHLTTDLKIENYTLPAGTNVYLSFYSTHREKKYWKHPESFYPDHFTPEEIKKRPKYSFTPFSMGPRNCPGYKFAMLSMKSALSHVIRRYKFTTTLKMEDLKYKISLMFEPVQGYPISLHRR